jgi:HEAT repeat protein
VEGRNGLLTLAVYLTATTLIVLAAAWGIYRYAADARLAALQPIVDTPGPELAVARVDLAAKTEAARSAGDLEQQRIRLLEAMLQDKTQRLRQLSTVLDEKTAELEELRTRYDKAVVLAVESLTTNAADQPAKQPARPDEAGRKADPAVLEAELSMAREVHQSLLSDVTALQEELSHAQQELDQLKTAQEQEAMQQLREATVLENAAAGVLVRVGRQAVPALRDALNHPSPVVRRWAATVLGGMGSEAEDALPALTEALSDVDSSVRRAAQTALEAIER